MTAEALVGTVGIRPLRPGDGPALARAYARNREHLAPWEPLRPESWFTQRGQEDHVGRLMGERAAGRALPWVLLDGDRVVGAMTVSGIVRGPFLSGNLGYWVDGTVTGRGVATAAVAHVLAACARDGLHRVQAGTLVHNAASQTVLRRNGFDRIGLAPRYLLIAGRWQDHVLYQRLLGDG
ncbi:GNAT family N-acetyltransferase [Georgenia sp. EYE_87]|uniref:GNAT family N-acetyltransferase n=1 Tax=Georgenia sp. EYE_87 TaxID=2853448 RepID=UPI00200364CF|nr:GNAT family N-acetyltransferase [Georgenia sp. EYE_87]MCK6209378.1 GNAT family N-acetyltransferase [Georgenia sp. EYE_87]